MASPPAAAFLCCSCTDFSASLPSFFSSSLLVFFIWKNQKEKERLIAGNSKITAKLADLTEKCILVIQENNHNNEKLAERLGDLISNVYKDKPD